MPERVEAAELRTKNIEELKEQLALFQLEYQKTLQEKQSRSVEHDAIRTARKNIARCNHIIHEKQLEQAVEQFKGKKFIPVELRPKLNKALRMRLTDKQRNKLTYRASLTASKTRSKIFCYTE